VLQTTVQLRQVVPLLVLERAVKVLVLGPLALEQLVPEQLEQELLATEPRVPEPPALELLVPGLQELVLAKDRELVSCLIYKNPKHEC
jgi:hypothetical protein